MLINNQISLQNQRTLVAPKAAPEVASQEPEIVPEDTVDSVGWLDVGRGLVGAVVTASIETVGNTVSSIPQAFELAAEAEVALVKNQTIGPWLKSGIGLLTLAAVPVGIAATAIGSLGFGLYRGFSEGIKSGIGGAIKAAVEDVKSFNTDLASGARSALRDFGNQKLEEGEEKFDVSPVRAAVGVAAGVGTTVQGAAQLGWTTAKNIPSAFITANKAISRSDFGTPLKTAGHALSIPLAAVALPLGFVGGAAVGLGMGVYEGYREGFTEGFSKINELNNSYSEHAHNFLAEAGREIIED